MQVERLHEEADAGVADTDKLSGGGAGLRALQAGHALAHLEAALRRASRDPDDTECPRPAAPQGGRGGTAGGGERRWRWRRTCHGDVEEARRLVGKGGGGGGGCAAGRRPPTPPLEGCRRVVWPVSGRRGGAVRWGRGEVEKGRR